MNRVKRKLRLIIRRNNRSVKTHCDENTYTHQKEKEDLAKGSDFIFPIEILFAPNFHLSQIWKVIYFSYETANIWWVEQTRTYQNFLNDILTDFKRFQRKSNPKQPNKIKIETF